MRLHYCLCICRSLSISSRCVVESLWPVDCGCVSFVFPSSCEALAKLSVLSSNFTTCVKLKAVVWKKHQAPFFPLHSISSYLYLTYIHSSFAQFLLIYVSPFTDLDGISATPDGFFTVDTQVICVTFKG